VHPKPAFATDAATAAYYDRRAAEYDDWFNSRGVFAERDWPGWEHEVLQLVELVQTLPAIPTLDVACGTGFLTRHLRGFVVGIDRSSAVVALAQTRLWLERSKARRSSTEPGSLPQGRDGDHPSVYPSARLMTHAPLSGRLTAPIVG
jgi:SAM-dependent methyltransferase